MTSYDTEQRKLLLEAGRRKFEELRKKHKSAINELTNVTSTNMRDHIPVSDSAFSPATIDFPSNNSFVQNDTSFESSTIFQNSSNLHTPLRTTFSLLQIDITGASHLLPPNLTPIHFAPPANAHEKLNLLTKVLPLEATQPEVPHQLKEENIQLKNQLADAKLQLADMRDQVSSMSAKHKDQVIELEKECTTLRNQIAEQKEAMTKMVPTEQLFSIQDELHRIIGEAAALNTSLTEASAKNYATSQELDSLQIRYDSLLISSSVQKMESEQVPQLNYTISQLEQENKQLQTQLDAETKKTTKLMDKLEIIRQKEENDADRLQEIIEEEVAKAVAPLQEENAKLKSAMTDLEKKFQSEVEALKTGSEQNTEPKEVKNNKKEDGIDIDTFNLLLKKLANLEQTVQDQMNTIEELTRPKSTPLYVGGYII